MEKFNEEEVIVEKNGKEFKAHYKGQFATGYSREAAVYKIKKYYSDKKKCNAKILNFDLKKVNEHNKREKCPDCGYALFDGKKCDICGFEYHLETTKERNKRIKYNYHDFHLGVKFWRFILLVLIGFGIIFRSLLNYSTDFYNEGFTAILYFIAQPLVIGIFVLVFALTFLFKN